ncbi:hypothetical protein BCR39DRAFT_520580 [Naematelia encephala]|uniref:mRNA export factor MEX67 n=1 Tax=Naematelia encephala TaxID=71784 RepID=A0A1Y2BHC8_9TREE|nr:hypothetical protein BCR39DRAFT_520580 [Naematelia encephala]
MAAFLQALDNATPMQNGQPSLSVRGAANGRPSARPLTAALRGAGIAAPASGGMEVDRPRRGAANRLERTIGSSSTELPPRGSGPSSRSRTNLPYNRPTSSSAPPSRGSGSAGRASRINPNIDPGRLPQGHIRHTLPGDPEAVNALRAELNKLLASKELEAWIVSRHIAPGQVDLSALDQDPFLRQHNIPGLAHPSAPRAAMANTFWHLLDKMIQKAGTPITTLSLARNSLTNAYQFHNLASRLPHIRALDLSQNNFDSILQLEELLSRGEKRGKATGGGGLKALIELKLDGCPFREKMLASPGGDQKYQHEILKRFPGLLILDQINLNRIVFPIERQAKVILTNEERDKLKARPFTFPVDVQGGLMDDDVVKDFSMSFCAKFFPLFDSDRQQLLPAYAQSATISMSANTPSSYSYLASKLATSKLTRPKPLPMEPWSNLPSRNFLKTIKTAEDRMRTLKMSADSADLVAWWQRVPKTSHPLNDAAKWCFDAFVAGGQGRDTKLCLVVQGEFAEGDSGCLRSFSRTFILADVPEGSAAQAAGWPVSILSDTTIVYGYLSNGAFADDRSLAKHGVTVQPIDVTIATAPPPPAMVSMANPTDPKEAMVRQMMQQTGMNMQFASMCLEQNGWVYDIAVNNFEEIRSTIPPEAFQQ